MSYGFLFKSGTNHLKNQCSGGLPRMEMHYPNLEVYSKFITRVSCLMRRTEVRPSTTEYLL